MIIDPQSGLYLPKKRRELWPQGDAKKFRALAQMLEGRKTAQGDVAVQLLLVCAPCSAAEGRMVPCEAGRHETTGEITLTCKCTVRVMEGLR